MSKELDFLLHQARFVGGLDPHTMPPSGVASHLRTLASAVMAYDEFNPAAPSASPDLDRVKFHACLHCGWRGRRYAVEAKLLAKRCPECGQPVLEETTGITTAADDAGDDTSASACQRCGKPGDFRMGDFHHIWAQDEWDCVASDGPETPAKWVEEQGVCIDHGHYGMGRCPECPKAALPTVGCDTPGCTNTAKHLWAPGDGTETYVCEQHAGPEGPVVDDVGADEHDWSPWHDVGNGTERRVCVTWDCFAQEFRQAADGPSAEGRIARMAREAGIEAPIRPDSENEVSSPRSDDDVGVDAPGLNATAAAASGDPVHQFLEGVHNRLMSNAGMCWAANNKTTALEFEREARFVREFLDSRPSASDTELLEVAENALGQAGMMFDRIQKAAPAAVEKVDHLGPTLAVLRQAHDEIHNEVERRKRSAVADGDAT